MIIPQSPSTTHVTSELRCFSSKLLAYSSATAEVTLVTLHFAPNLYLAGFMLEDKEKQT